jgi:hypothetical protein
VCLCRLLHNTRLQNSIITVVSCCSCLQIRRLDSLLQRPQFDSLQWHWVCFGVLVCGLVPNHRTGWFPATLCLVLLFVGAEA